MEAQRHDAARERPVQMTQIDLDDLGDYQFNWSRGESHQLQSPTWLTSDEMATILSQMAINSGSGDIYARLRNGD